MRPHWGAPPLHALVYIKKSLSGARGRLLAQYLEDGAHVEVTPSPHFKKRGLGHQGNSPDVLPHRVREVRWAGSSKGSHCNGLQVSEAAVEDPRAWSCHHNSNTMQRPTGEAMQASSPRVTTDDLGPHNSTSNLRYAADAGRRSGTFDLNLWRGAGTTSHGGDLGSSCRHRWAVRVGPVGPALVANVVLWQNNDTGPGCLATIYNHDTMLSNFPAKPC
ncbi:hypothetical protein NDU88_005309 [Pleurodeles waltl]|uniref:Uncharacterized protein n=1 Tax=Pleurodeles waltl TaxID=8319 RepID=A0AAV7RI51_PLEWA|nr:hypothetical protein NDU88_005309 [Pleurodeles waltl]